MIRDDKKGLLTISFPLQPGQHCLFRGTGQLREQGAQERHGPGIVVRGDDVFRAALFRDHGHGGPGDPAADAQADQAAGGAGT